MEFGLVLPLLAMLLLGVFTSGVSFSHGLGLTNAVREGARFGATTTPTGTPSAPPFTAAQWDSWANDVIDRTRATQMDDPSHYTTVCVMVQRNTSTTANAVPNATLVSKCSAGATEAGHPSPPSSPAAPTTQPIVPPKSCVVTVWGSRLFTINALLLTFDDKLMTRDSIAQYERDC